MTGAPRRLSRAKLRRGAIPSSTAAVGGDDQDEDFDAGVRTADAEVMESAGVAQGEFAAVIDGVVADAEVWSGSMPGGLALGRVM